MPGLFEAVLKGVGRSGSAGIGALAKSAPKSFYKELSPEEIKNIGSNKYLDSIFSTPKWLDSPQGSFSSHELVIPQQAKDLGYNDLLFHFTKSRTPFEEFKPGELGTHAGTLQAAMDRQSHIQGIRNQSNIIPLFFRKGKSLEMEDQGTWSPFNVANELEYMNKHKKNAPIDNYDRYSYIIENIANNPASAGKTNPYYSERLANTLNKMGYNSIHYKNGAEDPGSISYIGLSPSQFRVPWAKFDPVNVNSGNIYAGIAGGSVALPTALDWLKNATQSSPDN